MREAAAPVRLASGWRLCLLVTVVLMVAACTTSSVRQTDSLVYRGSQASVVLMPLDVELYELTAAGLQELRADWTSAAETHLLTTLKAREAGLRIALRAFDDSGLAMADLDRLVQIQRLHAAVGNAVVHHHFKGGTLPSKGGTLDWTLGPGVQALRATTGADYALFIHVRDSYTGVGRAAVMAMAAVFGIVIQGGRQTGFASLVDLDSGRIVWFNHLTRSTGDLRTAEAAAGTTDALLAGFPQ